MLSAWTTMAMGPLAALLGLSTQPLVIMGTEPILGDGFNCVASEWLKEPAYERSLLSGTIGITCKIEGRAQVGLPGLKAHLHEKVRAESKEILEGPIDEVYADLPSQRYLGVVEITSSNNSVWMKQEAHIASNDVSQVKFATFSKEIRGDGYARYLKVANAGFNLDTEAEITDPQLHTVAFWADFTVEKPFLIPGGVFKNQVVESVENGFQEQITSFAAEVRDNL